MLKDKRGIEPLYATVVFIVLTALFFVGMFIFVARAGTDVGFYEQVYAKKIALIIDTSKPGTEVEIDASQLFEIAKKNKFTGKIVEVDEDNNEVIVSLAKGKGYSFDYFNDNKILSLENRQKGSLTIKVENE